ncbi:septal ring lytic transglycosylase RlpA family protein [Methylocaldum gracile]
MKIRTITMRQIGMTASKIGWFLLGAMLLPGCATQSDYRPFKSEKNIATTERHPRKQSYNQPYRVKGKTYYPLKSARGYKAKGVASWYGWESGHRTAMGSRFNPNALTAAHRTLPLPSRVRVTNLTNKRSVEVVVNDRGPFITSRLIDLSHAAAKALGIKGTARVEVMALD